MPPCCYVTDKADDFGDVNNTPIREIKNNDKYQAARGLFNGDFKPETYVGCQNCPVYLETEVAQRRGTIDVPRPEPVMANVKVQLNGMNGNGTGAKIAGNEIAAGSKIDVSGNGTAARAKEPVASHEKSD